MYIFTNYTWLNGLGLCYGLIVWAISMDLFILVVEISVTYMSLSGGSPIISTANNVLELYLF